MRKSTHSGLITDTVYGEDAIMAGLGSYPLGHYQPGQMAQGSEYLYIPSASGPMPVAVQIADELYAIHSDHLNTPRRLTDASGLPVWQWVSSAFGEIEATDASTGFVRRQSQGGVVTLWRPRIAFNLRYPGQHYDNESGLHYNHHRYYDPYLTVGYTQADPIGLDGGWNRFGYVNGNPLSYIDPDGLQFFDLTTLAGARRNTTLDDAVRAGAWTRAVTLPAVTAGLTPSAVGLVGSASAPLFCVAPETITVSRWGREGLEAGDWVMKGGQNWWTYARSFKWQPGMGNQFAPYGAGASYQIPASAARWPTGIGIDGAWKGLFGQRVYLP